ncbi:MAG: hypothetical protein LBT00_00900, partial [Spirochaetaceae bacterium]|nr:hypothetical protein [Spirochaetaceae bacterium]
PHVTFKHENEEEIANFYTNGMLSDTIMPFYDDNESPQGKPCGDSFALIRGQKNVMSRPRVSI